MASALLNMPPPSPANAPLPSAGVPPPQPGATQPQGTPGAPDDSPVKALVEMGSEISRALSALSDAGGGIEEFAQADKLVQQGLAKLLQGQGTPDMAASATASGGAAFPGPI